MQTQDKHQQRYPNFLYVGAGKSGSTWIFEIFRDHPEIFVPISKDIMFFDRYYHLGINWYLRQFSNAKHEKAVGELSHDYFLSEETAHRIHKNLPNAKIIFCLREGVDRTYSEYLYDRTLFQFVPKDIYNDGFSFEEFACLPQIVRRSDYYNNMKPFFELFPRNNILVLFMDDLRNNPIDFAKRLFNFLEVNPNFKSDRINEKFNQARYARSKSLANIAYVGGSILRRLGQPKIVGGLKRQNWFDKILYKSYGYKREKPKIPKEVILRLQPLYHKDYDKLADLIRKPLPTEWSQDNS